MEHYLNIESQIYTYIGKNTTLKGEFDFHSPTIISASMEGEIKISENSLLKLERDSFFKGVIKCQDIQVFGKVEGDIISTGKVTLYPTSEFTGKIKAKNLDIHPGSIIDMEANAEV